MDTREDHGSYYPGGEKVIPIREFSGNVKKVNGIAPDAAGNVQVPTDDTDAVRFTAQSLTDEQKEQARSNIGAIASAPVTSVNNKTGAVTLTAADVGAGSASGVASAVATAQGAATNARNAALEIAAHKGNTNNPHNVTAGQVKAVSYEQQTLTDEQKAQARANIGAIASAPVASVNGKTGEVVLDGGNINYAPGTTLNSQIDAVLRVADEAFNAAQSALEQIDYHRQNYENPHIVTAHQTGAASDFEVQRKVSKTTIEALGEDYTMDELKDKINTIIRALMACAVVCFGLFAFGDTVDTARLGSLKSSAMVVTNVHFTAYQPILTAGENITISNNVISAGGGSVAPTGFENQTNTISYPTIAGNAVNLAITDAGVLSVNSNGWTDGQSVFVTIRPAGSYTVQGINLIGYGTFPANASQCVIWKVGTAFYLSVISAL